MQINHAYTLAENHRQAGRWQAAENAYRNCLAVQHDNRDATFGLALVLQEMGQWQESEKYYLKLLKDLPNNPILALNLGNLYLDQEQYESAKTLYKQGLNASPEHPLLWYNLGRLNQLEGDLVEAEKHYRQALKQAPDFAQAYNSLGVVLQGQERYSEAHQAYNQALAFQPDLLSARNNWGVCLLKEWRLAEAESCFRQVLAQAPDFVEARLNLAQALRIQGQAEAAVSTLQALEQSGQKVLGQIQLIHALTLPPVYLNSAEITYWRNHLSQIFEQLSTEPLALADPWKEVQIMPFYLAYQGGNDRSLMEQLSQIYLNSCPRLHYTAPHCQPYRGPNKKVRIGFISYHLREHTIAKIFAGMLAQWNREDFERILIFFAQPNDAWGQRMQASVDGSLVLSENFWQAREQIAELQADILIWLDLGMEPRSWFLAYARLAPIQAVTWGHPVTTGIPTLDYFISNQVLEPPEAQAHYSEKLITLSALHPIYPSFQQVLPERERFGFLPNEHIYLCPQSLFKLHPDLDPLWESLLKSDPRAKIILLDPPILGWKELLLKRFQTTLPDTWQRIHFIQRMAPAEFQQLLCSADVLLDSGPFGAGNTAYEALGLGCPIVTWPGEFLRGRFSQGFYRQMGLEHLSAVSAQDYLKQALQLAHEPDLRQSYSKQIQAAQDLIFENPKGLRELEALLLAYLSEKNGTYF
jgi:protein O-GlcNAc transferase